MEEYIDIVTKEGKTTGKSVPKSKIHKKGLYHNTAHIWFHTEKGDILLAQRAASKVICPLMWDVSVAGHIDAGETVKQAAVREIKEEINLDVSENELQLIGVFECFQTYDNGIIDNEFHHTFISKLKVPISELTPQIEEVEALKLVSLEGFKKLLENIGKNNHFVPSNKSSYEIVLQNIQKIAL